MKYIQELKYQAFQSVVSVLVGYTQEQMIRHLKRVYDEDLQPSRAYGETIDIRSKSNQYIVIRLPKVSPDPADVNVVTHECFHAVVDMANWIGDTVEYHKNEHQAMIMGHMVQKILLEARRRRVRTTRRPKRKRK